MTQYSLLCRQLLLWRLHWPWGVWGWEKEKKCGGVACQNSKSVHMDYMHPSPLWNSDSTWGPLEVFPRQNYYKSSLLRKFFVILTFWHGDKQACCKYSNLALMHHFIRNYFLLCLLFHFPCLLSGENLPVVSVVSVFIQTFASLVFYFSKVCCQWFHLALVA